MSKEEPTTAQPVEGRELSDPALKKLADDGSANVFQPPRSLVMKKSGASFAAYQHPEKGVRRPLNLNQSVIAPEYLALPASIYSVAIISPIMISREEMEHPRERAYAILVVFANGYLPLLFNNALQSYLLYWLKTISDENAYASMTADDDAYDTLTICDQATTELKLTCPGLFIASACSDMIETLRMAKWFYNIPTAIEHELLAVDHENQVTVGLAHVDSWKSHDTRHTSPLSL